MNPHQYEIPFCVDYNKKTFLKIYGLSTVMERAAEGTKTQLQFQTHTHIYTNYQL